MKKWVYLLFSFLVLFFLVQFSCMDSSLLKKGVNNDFNDSNNGTKTGSVSIFIQSNDNIGTSRSVVADFNSLITSWNLTLTSNDGFDTINRSVTSGTVNIDPIYAGNWNILIEGKNSSGTTLANGESTVEILEDEVKSVNIATTFLQVGTGSFSLTLTFPLATGIDSVTGQIIGEINGETNEETLTPVIDTTDPVNGKVTFAKTSLPSGSYPLKITFKRGEVLAGIFIEAINIWDDTTSDKWLGNNEELLDERAFTESEFFSRNASLQNLTFSDAYLPDDFIFSSEQTDGYIVNIWGNSVKFTPTESIQGQKIEYSYNGSAYTTKKTDNPIAITLVDGGEIDLIVRVTAPDKVTQKSYTLNLRRVYKITYDGNTSTSGDTPPIYGVLYDLIQLSSNGYTKTTDGKTYTFIGWNEDVNGALPMMFEEEDYYITVDKTLYAQWTITSNATVTFSTTPGFAVFTPTPGMITVTAGQPITTEVNIGETVLTDWSGWKWYENGTLITGVTGNTLTYDTTGKLGDYIIYCSAIHNDIFYSGEFKVRVKSPVSFTVGYDANGGVFPNEGSLPNDDDVPSGGSHTVEGAIGIQKAGYAFVGWNTKPDGDGDTYSAGDPIEEIIGNIVLYAKWGVIPAENRVAELLMDGDLSGGTASVAPTSVSNRKGEANKALLFNNSPSNNTNNAEFNDPALCFTDASSFSVSVWTKASSASVSENEHIIIVIDMPSNQFQYGLYFKDNESIGSVNKSGEGLCTVETPTTAEVWIHHAITYDGSTQTLSYYVGGILRGSTTYIYSASTGYSTPLRIAPNYTGAIDDLRIYSNVLTGEEIVILASE